MKLNPLVLKYKVNPHLCLILKHKVNKCFFTSDVTSISDFTRTEGDTSFVIYHSKTIIEMDLTHFLDLILKNMNISVNTIREIIDENKKNNTLTSLTFFELLAVIITGNNGDPRLENICKRFNQFQQKSNILDLLKTIIVKIDHTQNKNFELLTDTTRLTLTTDNASAQEVFLSYGFKRYHNDITNKLDNAVAFLEKKYSIENVTESRYQTIIYKFIDKNSGNLEKKCHIDFKYLLNCLLYDNHFNEKVEKNSVLFKQIKRHLKELNICFRLFELYEKLGKKKINLDPNNPYIKSYIKPYKKHSLSVLIEKDKMISAKDSGKIIKLLTSADNYYHKIFINIILPDLIQHIANES